MLRTKISFNCLTAFILIEIKYCHFENFVLWKLFIGLCSGEHHDLYSISVLTLTQIFIIYSRKEDIQLIVENVKTTFDERCRDIFFGKNEVKDQMTEVKTLIWKKIDGLFIT